MCQFRNTRQNDTIESPIAASFLARFLSELLLLNLALDMIFKGQATPTP
jgi:hypothetical protein